MARSARWVPSESGRSAKVFDAKNSEEGEAVPVAPAGTAGAAPVPQLLAEEDSSPEDLVSEAV